MDSLHFSYFFIVMLKTINFPRIKAIDWSFWIPHLVKMLIWDQKIQWMSQCFSWRNRREEDSNSLVLIITTRGLYFHLGLSKKKKKNKTTHTLKKGSNFQTTTCWELDSGLFKYPVTSITRLAYEAGTLNSSPSVLARIAV